MSLTKTSLVLLDKGYTPLHDVKAGDICLTPLGPTPVEFAGFNAACDDVRVEVTSGCTYLYARRLLCIDGWRVVLNVPLVGRLRRIGMKINTGFEETDVQPTPPEVFTFGATVQMNMPIDPELGRTERWGLITTNGIAVVGDVVVGCRRRPPESPLYLIGGEHISTEQLEQFKHANF